MPGRVGEGRDDCIGRGGVCLPAAGVAATAPYSHHEGHSMRSLVLFALTLGMTAVCTTDAFALFGRRKRCCAPTTAVASPCGYGNVGYGAPGCAGCGAAVGQVGYPNAYGAAYPGTYPGGTMYGAGAPVPQGVFYPAGSTVPAGGTNVQVPGGVINVGGTVPVPMPNK